MYYRTLKIFFADKALRELSVLVLFALLLFLSAVEAQLYTRMEEWLGPAVVGWLREGWAAAFFLVPAVGLFALRRWREAVCERKKRRLRESELAFQGMHDLPTGLYNRSYFEQCMEEFASAEHFPVGMIICDVDGLKLINDTLGNAKGDHLIETAARAVRFSCGENATAFRIDGDEFAILLRQSSPAQLEAVVERIEKFLEDNNRDKNELPISLSIGYAVGDKDMDLLDIFQQADSFMYRKKLHCNFSPRSAIVQTLAKTLEARDDITEGHAERLETLMILLAQKLELEEYKLSDIRLFARFHDLGKVGIPDAILMKAASLSDGEYMVMKQHSLIGYRIALTSGELSPIADWILMHHERWDGSGYPLGIAGKNLPIECRMLCIVDAFDAMRNDRPYRKAMSYEAAVQELLRGRGKQFDPDLVDLIVKSEIFREK